MDSSNVTVAISVGGLRGGLSEDLADRVADLVDLLQRGQEVDGARLLPVVHLLAAHVDLESAFFRRCEGDRGLPIVHRAQLSRHTDGYGEVPSVNAVDDLD